MAAFESINPTGTNNLYGTTGIFSWTFSTEATTNLSHAFAGVTRSFAQVREALHRELEPLNKLIAKFKQVCEEQLRMVAERQALWKRSGQPLFLPARVGMVSPETRYVGVTFRRRVCALSSSYRVRFP